MTDPFDVLRSHVRAVALLERPSIDVDDLIAGITGANLPAPVIPLRPTAPRRRLLVAGAIAAVVAGGAGVAAFRGEPPDARIPDVICRSTAALDSSSLAVEPGDDPIGACAELWLGGSLPDIDRPATTGVVPRLVACTGAGRPVEVYPLDGLATCADLGLVDADVAAASDPVGRLPAALTAAINDQACPSAADAVRITDAVLDELGLSGWTVSAPDRSVACAAVSVDPVTSTVLVFADPFASPTDPPPAQELP